jgi:RHS repeat-associated protein
MNIALDRALQQNRQFDSLSRVVRESTLLSNKSFVYDQLSNLTATTNQAGRVWSTYYDALSRPIVQTRPSGAYEETAYSSAGHRLGFSNAKGKETLFDVDKMGRVTKITNPLNNETSFSYDLNGNVTAKTNALEEVTSYYYDSMNRVTNIVHQSKQKASFEYNLAGELTAEKAENTESQFAYDSMGEIIQSSNSVFSVPSVVNYSYNLNGNRTGLTLGDLTVNYTYNAENLTTNITFTIPSTNSTPMIYSSSFDYDDALRLSDIKYANNVEGTFAYDAENRVVGFTYKTNSIAFIDHTIIRNEQGFKTHQLIDAGLIPLFPENQRKISTYNDVDQLTSEQIQTDTGWTDTDYTWNANGCLTKLSLDPILTNNNISLDYDYNNRLVGSTKNTDSAEYIYDASGARVARIFTDDTTSTTNFFIIDHTDSLKRPLAETDVSGNILRYYIWNGFMLLAHIDISENQNPTVVFYHQDELGNTLALTDSDGQITDQFAYMPYGSTRHQPTALSTFTLRPSPFLWLGGYGVFYEPELDIHLTVHRAYSADLRRFISPDPLGIDSFPNLYAYANMNPLAFIDPWGLCAEGNYSAFVSGGEYAFPSLQNWFPETYDFIAEPARNFTQNIINIRNQYIVGPMNNFFGVTDEDLKSSEAFGDILISGMSLAMMTQTGVVKPSISKIKPALRKAHKITGKLPKGTKSRLGGIQRGTSTKGYRFDPPHSSASAGSPDASYHINVWDYTKLKRKAGGLKISIPIE